MRLSSFGILCALMGASWGWETVQDAGEWLEIHVELLGSSFATSIVTPMLLWDGGWNALSCVPKSSGDRSIHNHKLDKRITDEFFLLWLLSNVVSLSMFLIGLGDAFCFWMVSYGF